MLYQLYEYQRSLVSPVAAWAKAFAGAFANPASPLACVPGARYLSAGYDLLNRIGKAYAKPRFNLHPIVKGGRNIPVVEQTILEKPFCRLLNFKRFADNAEAISQLDDEPVVLVCAPLSGHYSTLLRDTVQTLLGDHDVYITDWVDAKHVPLKDGAFHLDDYVAYIQEFIRHIGARNLHVLSVCQPTVPVLAAISLMASRGEDTPLTMTMMGGPIDARRSPTAVNALATGKSFGWFENNLIYRVPANHAGAGRKVYPGFLQHAGFVATNPDRHVNAYLDYYMNVAHGNDADAQIHRRFYDEYNAVLDMDANFYLETIQTVFQEFRLACGTWEVDGEPVRPQDIKHTALFTVEGELDDITGEGQTRAAHELCSSIPANYRRHLTAEGCGHYGIFAGRRWRSVIYPQVCEFIREHDRPVSVAAEADELVV